MKLVLAHGILGFGQNNFSFGLNYFNGVRPIFEDAGFEVFEPSVEPLGSLDVRSRQLADQINFRWPGASDIVVIAHSMGGLDARRVIAQYPVGTRIKRLITIATPHYGSPVADAVLGDNAALLEKMPPQLLAYLQKNLGAIEDLKTRDSLRQDSLQDPDQDWVNYQQIACVIGNQPLFHRSPLFALSQAIGQIDGANDGVVSEKSATRGKTPLAIWQGVDHGEAIGWSSAYFGLASLLGTFLPPAEHLARYRQLADLLKNP